jgi:hypothetical protein
MSMITAASVIFLFDFRKGKTFNRTRMTRLRAEALQRAGADWTDLRGFNLSLYRKALSALIRPDQILSAFHCS